MGRSTKGKDVGKGLVLHRKTLNGERDKVVEDLGDHIRDWMRLREQEKVGSTEG